MLSDADAHRRLTRTAGTADTGDTADEDGGDGADGASGFPLSPASAAELAREVVRHRYPTARASWLGGSLVWGGATATSDLDVTVLADVPPFRESLLVHAIPVEVFVHTDASLAASRAGFREEGLPTIARLIGDSVCLIDADGSGSRLQAECAAELADGPDPLASGRLAAHRYALTGLLADLGAGQDGDAAAVIAPITWEAAGRLLLAIERRWQGTGKALLGALRRRDTEVPDDDLGERLIAGLRSAAAHPAALIDAADAVLDRCGGRLFDGYRATLP